MKTIKVLIHKDGKVEVRPEGFQGPSCLEATQELLAYLGGKQLSCELTAEYYEQSNTQDSSQELSNG